MHGPLLLAVISSLVQAPANRDFERKLEHHPYFSRVLHARVESRPPYLFLIQQTGKGDTNAALVERYAQHLDLVLDLFERELVRPLGLKRREEQQLVVAVLGSPGDIDNYRNVAGTRVHFEGKGLYDPGLNAAVLFEDPFHTIRDLAELERSERHAFLHACMQAWYAPGIEAPSDSWVLEAIACELARRDPDVPDQPVAPSAEELRRFLLDLQDERLRWSHGRTLEELCTLSAPRELAGFFEQQAAPGRPAPPDLAAAERAFYRQSALLLNFLLEGAGRRYRGGCLAFLAQVFGGHSDWPTFARSFQPASAQELERLFLAWAVQSAGGEGIDATVVQQALLRGAPGSAADAAAAPADRSGAESPTAAEAALPTVPELAIDVWRSPWDERLAMALYELRRGRARAGLDILDRLVRETEDEGTRERAERERRRAAAWVELRDLFLRERVGSKAEIEFTYKGKKLKSRVLDFREDRLTLEKERAPSSLSPELIDPAELAQQIKPSRSANDWARLYPYVLQENPKALKLLKDEGEAGALKADLRADYPARLLLGDLMGRLDSFAWRAAPEKPAEARARIEELAAWRRDADGLDLLERKRPALRDHVRALLAKELAALAPQDFLRGKLAVRKDGIALLTYEFEDPRELEDFSSDNPLALARHALGKPDGADVPFHLEEGRLTGSGSAWLRSNVSFAAPLSVRYSMEFPVTQVESPACSFALGICSDAAGRFLWAVNVARLECYDAEASRTTNPEAPLFLGSVYKLELRHDGELATLFCDGEPQCSLGAGARKSGAFFLCAATDSPVRIERLEIEGRLTADSFERVKRARIELELARF